MSDSKRSIKDRSKLGVSMVTMALSSGNELWRYCESLLNDPDLSESVAWNDKDPYILLISAVTGYGVATCNTLAKEVDTDGATFMKDITERMTSEGDATPALLVATSILGSAVQGKDVYVASLPTLHGDERVDLLTAMSIVVAGMVVQLSKCRNVTPEALLQSHAMSLALED